MATVYKHEMNTSDFFDSVVFCNDDDTQEWEEFVQHVADDAAKSSGSFCYTEFELFMYQRGYMDQVGDILFDAMKAFTNKRINETDAGYDYC